MFHRRRGRGIVAAVVVSPLDTEAVEAEKGSASREGGSELARRLDGAGGREREDAGAASCGSEGEVIPVEYKKEESSDVGLGIPLLLLLLLFGFDILSGAWR